MIIPTADFNPMFAEDGVPFREKMLAYIQQEFSDLLACQPAAAAAVRKLAESSAAPIAATLPLMQTAIAAPSVTSMHPDRRQDRAA